MNFHAPAPKPPTRPLNSLEFVLQMARNPLAIWTEVAYREPIIRTEWLGGPIFVLNDPAAIRHVMVDNARNYAMQPLRQRVLRPILRDGLLTAEGELWRRTRKSIAPVFAPRNTTGLADAMRDRSRLFAAGLAAQAGQEIDIAHAMTLLTFDILQATLFTGDIAGDPQEFAAATAGLLKTMGRVDPMDVLDAPAFVPRLTRLMGGRSLRYFRDLIAETIERRQALLKRSPESAPRDLLTLLLEAEGLSRSEVEDNIITFIGAGHETTARALGWTIYLLSQAPEERALVEAELDSFDLSDPSPATWTERLPHTRAVFEEAMRLYPPAPSLNRMAIEDDSVDGMRIPKGAAVLILPWILHRHERLWSRPGEFVPDRFLPGKREAIDRYQYLPFGIGPRVCIGQYFAMQEGVIALAMLLKTLRFDYTGRTAPEPVQKITVQSAGAMPMRVSLR
ncbi:MAG TPA: cytochrome P450 [Devosia sp.]|jgi:cytochrome P450|nr:cytochrome P450 [Devosia sp.]